MFFHNLPKYLCVFVPCSTFTKGTPNLHVANINPIKGSPDFDFTGIQLQPQCVSSTGGRQCDAWQFFSSNPCPGQCSLAPALVTTRFGIIVFIPMVTYSWNWNCNVLQPTLRHEPKVISLNKENWTRGSWQQKKVVLPNNNSNNNNNSNSNNDNDNNNNNNNNNNNDNDDDNDNSPTRNRRRELA